MKERKQKNVFHTTESLEVGNSNTFTKTKGLMFFNAVFYLSTGLVIDNSPWC